MWLPERLDIARRRICQMPVRKIFFSEEKKQKTFTSLSQTFPQRRIKNVKVFWFFFSKKNCLLIL
jgi:hypothetical protein